MRRYLLQLHVREYLIAIALLFFYQQKEEALNAKIMSSKLLDKKLKSLQQENQRLLEALKAFGRRSANNAAYHPVAAGGGGVAHSSGVVGGGVFGGVNAAPLGISRPFRTVTPLHRKSPEMNQLSVDVNPGNGKLYF